MAMRPSTRSRLRRALWSSFFLLIVAYAAFAVSASGAEILHQLGLAEDVKRRSAPIFFIVHALAGTTALVAGPLQWITAGRSRTRTRRVHRVIGRAYVGGVLVAATTALRMAITFDVPAAGRVSFAVLAVLWTAATVLGVRRILDGDVPNHRRWMTRSYALTLFFLTQPIGKAIAESGVWRYEVAYPVAVSLAWLLNLLAAEAAIRWREGRARATRPALEALGPAPAESPA